MAATTTRFDLKDRSVLITGANRGLGAALCKTILQYSPKIIHAGYRTAPGDFEDPCISWRQLDIQDAASVAATVASIKELDVLVNNAGILIPTTTDLAQEMSNLEAMMDMHLLSPLKLIDALLPTLRASSQPMVVNMISMAAFASVPGCEGYCTSKAALHAATQGLRLKHPEIQCIGVYPGPTATDMTAGSIAPLADAMDSAVTIVTGMRDGKTAIFPDEAALAVESLVGAGVATLEQQFTTLLSD
ncbi:MAG: SDR family NAD(P)-dependent oxidoreductase [Proteobacteria bacterium]|nr:SDR family NAD(P)-dependent oxidoreductase [Pseudomonadota bacterium]